jgi:hypothetical protein
MAGEESIKFPIFRKPDLRGIGRADPTNKRIHIYFRHCGIIPFPFPGQSKDDIETFLNKVWSQFGTVTDTFYHCEYSYAFVSFQTHEMAASALASLKDPEQVQRVIATVVNGQPKEEKLAQLLFVQQSGGDVILPSWASRRR